jgi:hypothetical protein
VTVPTGEVRVEGLRELHRAFDVAGREMTKDLRAGLRSAAEPVRSDAESLAVQGIDRIGVPWSRMRVGVTRSSVYVAPQQRKRGRGSPRPNLAGLLLDRAMIPALEQNKEKVEQEVLDAIRDMARAWERVG